MPEDVEKEMSPEKKEALEKKIEGVEDKKKAEMLKLLSVKERLERKLKDEAIDIWFEDEGGRFPVKTRRLSTEENDNLVDLQNEISVLDAKPYSKENKKMYDQKMDAIFKILGEICKDPTLNYDWWKSKSGYSPDVLMTVMLRSMAKSSGISKAEIDDIKKFRGK